MKVHAFEFTLSELAFDWVQSNATWLHWHLLAVPSLLVRQAEQSENLLHGSISHEASGVGTWTLSTAGSFDNNTCSLENNQTLITLDTTEKLTGVPPIPHRTWQESASPQS
jgi:hypothetical protein